MMYMYRIHQKDPITSQLDRVVLCDVFKNIVFISLFKVDKSENQENC